MPCPNCGAVNPEGESRCFNCGASLALAPARYGRKVPITDKDVKPVRYPTLAASQKARKSRRIAALIALVVVSAGAAIGIYDTYFALHDNPWLAGSVYFAYSEEDLEHDTSYVHSWGTITNINVEKTSCRVWIHLYDDEGHSKKKIVDLGSVGAGDSVSLSVDITWPYDYYDSWMMHIDGEVRLLW